VIRWLICTEIDTEGERRNLLLRRVGCGTRQTEATHVWNCCEGIKYDAPAVYTPNYPVGHRSECTQYGSLALAHRVRRKGGKWGGGQLLRWLRRVGASKKNNEGRGPLRGERMGEKERGVGGSYGGGVSRGASQASSGAEWAVWDVWDSGGRAEHRVGTFMYDGEMHCQRREKGRVRVARRGTRPTWRRVQTNMPGSPEGLVEKEGFWAP